MSKGLQTLFWSATGAVGFAFVMSLYTAITAPPAPQGPNLQKPADGVAVPVPVTQ